MASDIDNALVAVKDALIKAIDTGRFDEVAGAIRTLQHVVPLFKALGYAYKGRELAERARNKLMSNLDTEGAIIPQNTRTFIVRLIAEAEVVRHAYMAADIQYKEAAA